MENIELNSNLMNELHKFPEVESAAKEVADAIAARAKEMAPVDSGNYQTGISSEPSNKKNSGVWRVISRDQKSSWIEFGTSTRPGEFVIRSAAESLGYKFKKKG
jgi:hypothetical protein